MFAITLTANNGVGSDSVQHFTLTVDAAASITSAGSTTFTVHVPGSFEVNATGYPAPSLSESGTLPRGVTFDPGTDLLSGTPIESGTYEITLTAHNGIGANAVQHFKLTVSQMHITTTSLSAATVGVAYDEQLTEQGGSGTLKWSVSAGALPKGIKLVQRSGVLTGTVKAKRYPNGGSFTFTVSLKDRSTHQNATKTLTLEVVR